MVVFVDIDGTLADWRPRSKKAGRMPDYKNNKKQFQMWLDVLQPTSKVLKDPPIKGTIKTIQALAYQGHHIIYLTGREEHLRRVTREWLENHSCPSGALYMRPAADRWKSPKKYKEAVMLQVLKDYNKDTVVIVFDDDGSGDCSKMYQKHKWTHLKVIL